jgi:hypothetical protein
VLVLAGGYTYWNNRTPSVGTAAAPAGKAVRAAALPAGGGAQIRLDLINEKLDGNTVGRRNVFQYYVPPPPPKPVPPPSNQQIVVQPPPPPRPITPVVVPPQTLLTSFRYDGVMIQARPGTIKASISDGTNRYNVTEGEYILGRYRVNRITETNVEIEDLDLNRRQTYPRRTDA